MNEEQKQLTKEAGKNFGFIVISAAVMYMLSGGSLDLIKTFKEADLALKVFYIIFGIIVIYYFGMTIRVGMEYIKAGKGQPIQQPRQRVSNPGTGENIETEQTIFEKFGDSLDIGMETENGQKLINQLKGRIESFYDGLDSLNLAELEEQYKEMELLRKSVNDEVSELYEQYKKLEQQMQLTLGMIRTKRAMGERIKQMRGR